MKNQDLDYIGARELELYMEDKGITNPYIGSGAYFAEFGYAFDTETLEYIEGAQ